MKTNLKTVRVHSCYSDNLAGSLIRKATFSRWNHTAIELSEGLIYDSTFANGVANWSYPEWRKNYSDVKSYDLVVTHDMWLEMMDFTKHQLGKSYDWTAIPALPFRANWSEEDKWFCSELVFMILKHGGFPVPDIQGYRVTPRDIDIILDTYIETTSHFLSEGILSV